MLILVFIIILGVVYWVKGMEGTRQVEVDTPWYKPRAYITEIIYDKNPGLLIFALIILIPLYVFIFGTTFLLITHPLWLFLAKSWLYILIIIGLVITVPLLLWGIILLIPIVIKHFRIWKKEKEKREEQKRKEMLILKIEREEELKLHEENFEIQFNHLKERIRFMRGENQEGEIQVIDSILIGINSLCKMKKEISRKTYDSFRKEVRHIKYRLEDISRINNLTNSYKIEIKDLINRLNDV
jgi:hypothetical protein